MRLWCTAPAFAAALLVFGGPAQAADGQVTIIARYVNSLDRVEPEPQSGIVTRHELTVVLSGGKQIAENWNNQAGRTVNRSASIRILGETGERGGAWRVMPGNKLQRSIDYPQNTTLLTIAVDGQSCRLDIAYHLKPGFSDYTFRRARSREWAHYREPKAVSRECAIQ